MTGAAIVPKEHHWMKYPARNRKKNAKRDPKMSRLFCPLVMEFVPRPYL